jgi:hypothetical protein
MGEKEVSAGKRERKVSDKPKMTVEHGLEAQSASC